MRFWFRRWYNKVSVLADSIIHFMPLTYWSWLFCEDLIIFGSLANTGTEMNRFLDDLAKCSCFISALHCASKWRYTPLMAKVSSLAWATPSGSPWKAEKQALRRLHCWRTLRTP